MINLNAQVRQVGISAARGVDLAMLRDQLKGTMPEDGTQGNSQTNTQAQAKTQAKTQTQATTEAPKDAGQLTADQQRQVDQLKQIDRKVRDHEQAHISAGQGLITSGPNYGYTYGPDGKRYATSGEVGIDTSSEKKPEANIDKGRRVQVAALAPSDPSPQDYRVASVGQQLVQQGYADLSRQQQDERAAAEQARKRQDEALAPQASATRERVENAYSANAPAASSVDFYA